MTVGEDRGAHVLNWVEIDARAISERTGRPYKEVLRKLRTSDRLDRHLDAAVGGHHDHGEIGTLLPEPGLQFEAVHSRHPEVGDDEVPALVVELRESLLAAPDVVDVEPVVLEDLAETQEIWDRPSELVGVEYDLEALKRRLGELIERHGSDPCRRHLVTIHPQVYLRRTAL